MNLIQQLQKTPKWKEFEEWYNEKFYTYGGIPPEGWYCGGDPKPGFIDLNISFQKGVFEKFIESQGYKISNNHDPFNTIWSTNIILLWKGQESVYTTSSFEELLIWYFNN